MEKELTVQQVVPTSTSQGQEKAPDSSVVESHVDVTHTWREWQLWEGTEIVEQFVEIRQCVPFLDLTRQHLEPR
jgi:hypothetical protein